MAKTYSQTFLYKQYSEYGKKLFQFVMSAERINTSSAEFSDVLFDIKRRHISNNLFKIATSPNVVIAISKTTQLPKAFKTFVAEDPKDRKLKLFIDATDIIQYKNGVYVCQNNTIDNLISYIISGMVCYIYRLQSNRLTGNASIILDGGEAFMRCFSYIIDRMYKTSSVQQLKTRIDYAIALYYLINILEKDPIAQFKLVKNYAMKISGITTKEAQIVDIMLESEDFDNISTFVAALGRAFKLKDIRLDSVMNLWMKSFGTGLVFAVEYFPALSMMMTNTYIGAYIDNQITIEKICGPQMKSFTETILKIGDNVS